MALKDLAVSGNFTYIPQQNLWLINLSIILFPGHTEPLRTCKKFYNFYRKRLLLFSQIHFKPKSTSLIQTRSICCVIKSVEFAGNGWGLHTSFQPPLPWEWLQGAEAHGTRACNNVAYFQSHFVPITLDIFMKCSVNSAPEYNSKTEQNMD